jgi:hypothetical protein
LPIYYLKKIKSDVLELNGVHRIIFKEISTLGKKQLKPIIRDKFGKVELSTIMLGLIITTTMTQAIQTMTRNKRITDSLVISLTGIETRLIKWRRRSRRKCPHR